ncbi:MAG: YcxB family protein [Clostridia bacterium]|nr:YcxB family protein [Clostridia bacterium]
MKNEYKITKDLMRSWAKEYHIHGAANIFLFILWCVVGVIGVSGMIFSIVLHTDWMVVYLYALMFVIAVFKLFIQRFIVWLKRYKLYSTTYGVTEWMRTTEFLEDEIVLTDHTSVSKFKYSNIQKIKEKSTIVMIFMNNNMALRLYKDSFVEGSWEECKKMILEKTVKEKS